MEFDRMHFSLRCLAKYGFYVRAFQLIYLTQTFSLIDSSIDISTDGRHGHQLSEHRLKVDSSRHMTPLSPVDNEKSTQASFVTVEPWTVNVTDITVMNFSYTVPSEPIISSCSAFINEYSEAAANFTKCSIIYARPLRFCEKCAREYFKANSTYHLIMQANAKDVSGAKCSDVILNSDRVQIIRQTEIFMEHVWETSYCNACFQHSPDENDTVPQINNDTKYFFETYHDAHECFLPYVNGSGTLIVNTHNSTSNMSVCNICGEHYRKLNHVYEELKEIYHGEVCMDIVDVVNSTRLKWSKVLRCSRPQVDIVPVILLSCFFSMLPVVFYIANKIHGTKTEKKILKQKRMKDVARAGTSTGSFNNSDSLNIHA